MKRLTRATIAFTLLGAVAASVTACGAALGASEPSARDRIVADIEQVLTSSGEFDAVEVSKGNLTVGWDLDVAVTTSTSLTGSQLDLMLRTVGDRIADTDIATVTFVHTPPDSVLGDSIHLAAREVDLVDKLTNRDQALTLRRDEVVSYAHATEG